MAGNWANRPLNVPYREGKFFAVTIEVTYDEDFEGKGARAALEKGIKLFGDFFLRSHELFLKSLTDSIWHSLEMSAIATGPWLTSRLESHGILFEGPVINPRPTFMSATYQVGILKGFVTLSPFIWKNVAAEPHGATEETFLAWARGLAPGFTRNIIAPHTDLDQTPAIKNIFGEAPIQTPPLPNTPQPVVRNMQANVNPNTNLTRTQTALLSPEEQVIASRTT